jgi:AcrR family transcriptional regulator
MPTGRRAQKHRETFRRVTATAAAMFAARGYAATTVEDIAAAAGVSAGTIYNHFGTKGAVLFAVTAMRSTEDLDAAVAGLDVERAAPLDAVMTVVMTYLRPMLELDRHLAAEAFAASFQPSRRVMAADFETRDELAIAGLVAVLDVLRTRGAVRDDVDLQQAAMLVFSVAAVALIMYLVGSTLPPDAVEPFIRAHVDLAMRGIAG